MANDLNKKTFQHIVVGVADDEASTEALAAAAQLAEQLGARLHLVHSVDDKEALERGAKVVQERLKQGLAGTRFAESKIGESLVVERGSASEVLLAEARRVSGDLIVIGPHRKQRFDFGSTAKDLMSHGEVPTLVQIGELPGHGVILVAIDLAPSSKKTLETAHALASALGSRLLILHCYEGPAFAYESAAGDTIAAPSYVIDGERKAEREEFHAFVGSFEWGSVEAESIFVEDDPAHYLMDQQAAVDMIVVGRHGRRGLLGSFGSLAGQLHKKLSSPLLIVPHE